MTHSVQHLILGGARSGKSRFAEQQAELISTQQDKQKFYIATATADDDEMADRITRHQDDRDARWHLIETPTDLATSLSNALTNHCLVIDCLTLWLSNCLHRGCWPEQKAAFLNALPNCQADVIMVSNEISMGVVPMGELSRRFVDELGWLHQALAEQCSDVSLIIAGLQSKLKSNT